MTEETLFEQAVRLPAAERVAFLDRECPDPALRARVEALLAADERSRSPLDAAQALVDLYATGAHIAANPNSTIAHVASDPDATTGHVHTPLTSASNGEGTIIAGRYRLLKTIGEGGMGSIYLAEQSEPVKRQVALKLIKAGMDSRMVLARFEAERQALAMMDHPNIARIYDGGVTDRGQPFFVMELVQGMPLTDYCDSKRLSVEARLQLFVQVCNAVQHAHQKGIIHRDLKPGNILVTEVDGRPMPMVIDFGVAKATEQRLTDLSLNDDVIVGTPAYMSPEQADPTSMDVDTRSDVYALGVILYELLTGSKPIEAQQFKRGAILEMLRMVREVAPPRPSTKLSSADALPNIASNRNIEPTKLTKLLQGELDWLVMKALEKDRNRRYETANGFAADVQRFLVGEAVLAHPPSRGYRFKKFVQRNRFQVMAASLIFLALGAGMVGTTLGLLEAQKQTEFAQKETKEKEKARLAEQKRADGERQAKEHETVQRQAAERNLAYATTGNRILGKVFSSLDPKAKYTTIAQLRDALKSNLKKAIEELEGASIGDPLVVARMRNVLGLSLLGLGEAKLATGVFEKGLATHQAELGPNAPDTLVGINNLAMSYEADGQLKKALPLYEDAVKRMRATVGTNHAETLTVMGNLGAGYLTDGEIDKALSLLEETLTLCKAKLDRNHELIFQTTNNLAVAYREKGSQKKALPLFEQVLVFQTARLGVDHPDTLITKNNLAVGYLKEGNPEKALSLFEETLRLQKAKLGPDHPDTLTTRSNLAEAYRELDKMDKALPLLEENLKVSIVTLGPDHPDIIRRRNNLAGGYRDIGNLEKAFEMFEANLEVSKKKLGADHPDTLRGMNNLAATYRDTGNFDKAMTLFEESYKLTKAKLGPDHPDSLTQMNNMASNYWSQRRFDKSVPLFAQLLPIQEKKFGRGHPDTLITLANLGVNLKDSGRAVEAIPMLEEAFTASKKYFFLGFAGPQLADTYLKAGRTTESKKLMGELLDATRKSSGTESPLLADQLAVFGRILVEAKEFVAAEPLLREALAIRDAKEQNHWRTFNTRSLLGGALLGQKKYAEAEPLLLKGYEGMMASEKTMPKEANTRLPEALDRLIELYTATNKLDEVKKYRELRAKYPPSKDAAKPVEKK